MTADGMSERLQLACTTFALQQRDSALTERRYRRKSLYQAAWIAELFEPHLRDFTFACE
jgi:hypothetical protein